MYHPRSLSVHTLVALPHSDWDESIYTDSLSLPAAEFRHWHTIARDTFKADWSWKTTAHQVDTNSIPAWITGLDSARSDLDWNLTLDQRGWWQKLNLPLYEIALLALLVGLSMAGFTVLFVKRMVGLDLPTWQPWPPLMIFAALFIFAHILGGLWNILQNTGLFTTDGWDTISTDGIRSTTAALLSLTLSIIITPLLLTVASLFALRNRLFPVSFAIVFLNEIVLTLVVNLLQGGDWKSWLQCTFALAVNIAWSIYFLRSQASHRFFQGR